MFSDPSSKSFEGCWKYKPGAARNRTAYGKKLPYMSRQDVEHVPAGPFSTPSYDEDEADAGGVAGWEERRPCGVVAVACDRGLTSSTRGCRLLIRRLLFCFGLHFLLGVILSAPHLADAGCMRCGQSFNWALRGRHYIGRL